MDFFEYKKDELFCEEVNLIEIAEIAPEQSELLVQPSQTFTSVEEDNENQFEEWKVIWKMKVNLKNENWFEKWKWIWKIQLKIESEFEN